MSFNKNKVDGIASIVNRLKLELLKAVLRFTTGLRYVTILHIFRTGSATTQLLSQCVRGPYIGRKGAGAQAGLVYY